MLRSSIYSASVLLLGASAFAQGNMRSQLHPVTSTVKNAGVYHLGTGTWTRGAAAALQGPDVVYSNTCDTGYYSGQNMNERWYDEGRLPSPTGPTTPAVLVAGGFDEAPGCNTSYDIQGFQIGYCTLDAAGVTGATVNIGFQSLYTACAVAAPTNAFTITGLPSTPTQGTQACWIATLDLQAASANFPLLADGTGAYFAPSSVDLFGWSFEWASTSTGAADGPLLCGSGGLSTCTGTDATRWDTNATSPAPIWPANQGAEPGGGMSTLNQFRIENNPTLAAGCYWFGGNPFGSFHLELYSTANCAPAAPLAKSCDPGVGGVLACPCSNPAAGSGRGCDNSAASGGSDIQSAGVMSLGADTLTITANNMRSSGTCIVLQGTTTIPAGIKFGQGVRCVGGTLKRLYVKAYSGGTVTAPVGADPTVSARSAALGDTIAPSSSRSYLVYYRDPILLGSCVVPDTFNASDTGTGTWAP